jgi:arginine decarboxylase
MNLYLKLEKESSQKFYLRRIKMYVPTKIFFTKGVGKHREYLASFELALRDARIEKYNIVSVSSIFPVGCKKVGIEEGLAELKPGQIIHAVMARNATNEPNRLIAASLGVAIPADKSMYGYLSEHHPYGETGRYAGDYAEDLAASMLATTLGIDFDPDKAWNEKEQVFKMSGKIVRTFNITQSARGDKDGLWTTVVAAAILLP